MKTPPMPALSYYSDTSDVVAQIRRRGIHPTEIETVATLLESLDACIDELREELREAQKV